MTEQQLSLLAGFVGLLALVMLTIIQKLEEERW
jgi:hypothetical protein